LTPDPPSHTFDVWRINQNSSGWTEAGYISMKISPYFENEGWLKALDRYALFTKTKKKDWSISESKLDLYRAAKRAFEPAVDGDTERPHFDTIYGDMKRWWGIGRNGNLATSDTVFALLKAECGPCSRTSGITLMNVHDRSCQESVVECLRKVRELKKLKSGDYPVMAVSKFLHFFNPGLFVIWDNAIVKDIVCRVFKNDLKSSRQDIEVNTDDEDTKRYLAYLLWAGKAVRQCTHDLMDGFATWFVEVVSDERHAEDFIPELKQYYAPAFEFVAIGSALLERKENGHCPACRQIPS
jgi:hypothetical protein